MIPSPAEDGLAHVCEDLVVAHDVAGTESGMREMQWNELRLVCAVDTVNFGVGSGIMRIPPRRSFGRNGGGLEGKERGRSGYRGWVADVVGRQWSLGRRG